MRTYFNRIKHIVPGFKEEFFDLPIKETGIDSIDLVVIRVELEKLFELEIPDQQWYGFNKLSDAIKYLETYSTNESKPSRKFKNIGEQREYEINLPQMAVNALSENWLLKELGDIHWKMLSKGVEQKTSQFKDDLGNRLYAAFVRISYDTNPMSEFVENEQLKLNGVISRFGTNAYLSKITGKCFDKRINAKLMSCFVLRQETDNSQISKGNPIEKKNHIIELNRTPEFLNQYRLLRKGLLDEIDLNKNTFPLEEDILFEDEYQINPYYEINGVGLLYFACYPIISDNCLLKYFSSTNKNDKFHVNYHTVFRDIFYFANCNADDSVIFRLNSLKSIDNKKYIYTSLLRKSDLKFLAKILTIKQSVNKP